MLPGAVQPHDGSLEPDARLSARRANDPAPIVTSPLSHVSTVVPAREPALRAGRVDGTSPSAPLIFRARIELYSTPESSLDDD
jgi:hypothetical protein